MNKNNQLAWQLLWTLLEIRDSGLEICSLKGYLKTVQSWLNSVWSSLKLTRFCILQSQIFITVFILQVCSVEVKLSDIVTSTFANVMPNFLAKADFITIFFFHFNSHVLSFNGKCEIRCSLPDCGICYTPLISKWFGLNWHRQSKRYKGKL